MTVLRTTLAILLIVALVCVLSDAKGKGKRKGGKGGKSKESDDKSVSPVKHGVLSDAKGKGQPKGGKSGKSKESDDKSVSPGKHGVLSDAKGKGKPKGGKSGKSKESDEKSVSPVKHGVLSDAKGKGKPKGGKSGKSKESDEKSVSPGKHGGKHSKEDKASKDKGNSNERSVSKEGKHSKDHKRSREKRNSNERSVSREGKHSKDHKRSREKRNSNERSVSKEGKHSKEDKASKDKRHSNERSVSKERKPSKENKGSKEKRLSNERSVSKEDKHSKEKKGSKADSHSNENSVSREDTHSKEHKVSREKRNSNENSVSKEGKPSKENKGSKAESQSNESSVSKEEETNHVTMCEQEMQSLKCEAGQTITVLTAMYGRKKYSVCPSKPIHSLNCEARSSLTKVKEACEGKDTCVLSAVNSVFGDPCRGTTKYLEVTYTCEGRGEGFCNGRKCHHRAKCRRGSCICNRGYYGDGYDECDKSCLCMVSGDQHYKTYDGQMIDFMGGCRYTLTRSMNRHTKCAFNVEVKNERRGHNTRVSFTRFVDFKIYGKRIRLDQGKKVFIDGEKRYLPVTECEGRVKVTSSGRYVQVWTECGVLVNFDGDNAVSVVVPTSFSEKMTGLCGDCDGKKNDFRTKDGRDVTKDRLRNSLIGNSYRVAENDTSSACVPISPKPPTCDPSLANRINRRDYCGELQNNNGRFSKCIDTCPSLAKSFFDACIFDLCSFEGEPKKLAKLKCNAMEAFAEECEENGIVLKWRSKDFCPMACDDPKMIYMADASGCPSTCVDPEAPSKCSLEPREGCVCKDGYALSDGKCIRLRSCGCVDDNGSYFPLGVKKIAPDCSTDYICRRVERTAQLVAVRSGRKCHRMAQCTLDEGGERNCVCNTGYEGDGYSDCRPLCGMKYKCHPQARCKKGKCRCKKGLSGDGVRECHDMCTCSAIGDPHYRTYDGQMLHFMGICKYILTKSTKEKDDCSVAVFVSNERRGRNRRVSYTKTVQVKVYGKNIVMKERGQVFVDGEMKYLPVNEMAGNLSIIISGKYVRLLTKCGHVVSWDGVSVVRVSIPNSYSGHLTGLCGDCNGKKDDFRTKDGKDVSREKNKNALIGNSYLQGRRYANDTENCVTTEDDVKCTKAMVERASKADQCGFINPKFGQSSPFYECTREYRSLAAELYTSCEFDVCAYFEDPKTRHDAICSSLEALEAECEFAGFNIRWRTPDFCPMTCQKNTQYSAAISGCPATCIVPDSESMCEVEDTEGCECLPGYLLSGIECVKADQCGCLNSNGDYLPLGTTFVSDDCTKVTECTNVNGEPLLEVQAVLQRCHDDGMCGMVDGRRQCVCEDGYEGDGITSCQPLCGGRHKCHVDAKCQEGECVCKAGKYGDGIDNCYDACVCTVFGDPHYRLFDGQTIRFRGTCKYSMSKLSWNETCSMDVQVETARRRNFTHVSLTQLVDVKIGDLSIKLLKDRRLTVNDIEMFTPYEDQEERFVVITKGRSMSLISKCGNIVSFDGVHAASIVVRLEFGRNLTGICGNCNGQKDDLRTKDGVDVSKHADRFRRIGNSYKIVEDTDDGTKRSCKTEELATTCSEDLETRAKSDEYCGKILDEKSVFALCVEAHLEAALHFFESCKMDVCKSNGSQEIACKSVEAFADFCQVNGHINKHWRTTSFCPLQCAHNERYSTAISGSPRTCEDPDATVGYPLAPLEGCACADGFVLSGNACVRQRDCGCYFNREYFPLNSTGPMTNCDQVQTCVHDNGFNSMMTVERILTCHKNAQCSNVDGTYKCKCVKGYKGDGEKHCEETKPDTSPPLMTTFKPSTPKVTPKPTPKTTTPRPKYVPFVECQMRMYHRSCGSSISLTGACKYKYSFSTQCRYSITMLMRGTEVFAKVYVNGRMRILRHRQTFRDCVFFRMIRQTITVTDNVCEKCTLEFIQNLTQKKSCRAP